MLYHSTRNNQPLVDSAQAVLSGLAPDGGLYVPAQLPKIDTAACLAEDTMAMAARIIGALLPDIENMDTLVRRAYTGKFQTAELTPTVDTGKFTVLELFRGPTSAFKDIALCMLPQLLTTAKSQKGMDEDILILTATSGDTGKAALAGFANVEGTKICVFYPQGGVSKVQRAQMVTQEGENVAVCAVEGNFDDAQTGVKRLFSDEALREELNGKGFFFSSANSINWGRVLPQLVYYTSAYCDLLRDGKSQPGEEVNVCVPTGNFGNILAAYYAREMGVPIQRFICASNSNNVLTDFIRTGVYDRNRTFHNTTSPSMDILISSNLERLLLFLSQDVKEVKGCMEQLNATGRYEVSERVRKRMQKLFCGYCCDDQETARVIARVYKSHDYLIDPHTAVAFSALEQYRKETGDETPCIVASTASPFKFCDSVLSALGVKEIAPGLDALEQLSRRTGCPVPAPLAGLRDKEIRFTRTVEKDHMVDAVLSMLG